MKARDQGLVGVARAAAGPDAVIFVTGLRTAIGSAADWAAFAEVKTRRVATIKAGPLDLTYAASCNLPTTQCASCMATRCGGGPTCVHTCLDPGPTCLVVTCNGEATCSGTTCGPYTCVGITCMGTCVPANCPTAISEVRVLQAGQIQLSFNSSTQLKYVLQYCTNLTERVWTEACTTNGNGGLLTLVHTNGATSSAYRLLIQNR